MIDALLLEDDPALARLIQKALPAQDIRVTHCTTVAEARAAIKTRLPAITLIDASVHTETALDFVRYARNHFPTIGIILLGSTSVADRIAGLEMGADEYLVTPLEMREVALRVRRLAGRVKAAIVLPTDGIQNFFGFTLDALQRTLHHKNYGWLTLTSMEFDLLLYLLRSNHQIISRDDVCREIHGRDSHHDDRTVDTLISTLRTKLKQACVSNLIVSVRGKGYTFCATVTPQPQPTIS